MRRIRKRNIGRNYGLSKRPILSLCVVVKNEEERITRFLAAVEGLVDETVVVDTGSTDKTFDLVQVRGCKLVRHPWKDDFSEARNASLQHATGDWVLILDADEAIHPRDFNLLHKFTREGKADAYRMITRNYTNCVNVRGWTPCTGEYLDMERGFSGWYPTLKVRLFKRRADVRFRGCVHELVEGSLLESEGIVGNCPVAVHHLRAWDTKSLKDRGEFYLRLGQKKVMQQPLDPRAHFELGVQYIELGKLNEAEAMLRKSVLLQEGIPAAKLVALYHSPSEAHTMLGVVLERLGRTLEAIGQYRRAIELNPRFIMALVNWGLLLERQGDLGGARKKYVDALSVSPENATLSCHLNRTNTMI